MNYEEIGFKAGLEIHQQLDMKKLFCNCQSELSDKIDFQITRYLQPVISELGEVDKAALSEMMKKKEYVYNISKESSCLVEIDEEPPHIPEKKVIDLALTVSLLLDSTIVDEIQFMRKIVIDGSNTTGFQRTGLIALDGEIDDIRIKTISLEEDAARIIKKEGKKVFYNLDRQGIPLIEIVTQPDISTPIQAMKIAEKIGKTLQSTEKVKKGLGTIRQDLNISIKNGPRIEIKGIQSLSSIEKIAEKEVKRQIGIEKIKKTLHQRIKKQDLENITITDIKDILKNTSSKIIQKNLSIGTALAIKLPGYHGLLKEENTRIGKEFAVHARHITGIKGILHSDELPGYGIDKKDVENIKKRLKIKDNDAFVIAVGPQEIVNDTLRIVIKKSQDIYQGLSNEVRKAMPDDTTEYLRPMPGAERMYPETDVPPIKINKKRIEEIRKNLPETIDEKFKRIKDKYKLNEDQTQQLLSSNYLLDFEKQIKKYPKLKNTIIKTYVNTLSELKKEGQDIKYLKKEHISDAFKYLLDGKYSKEAIPEIFRYIIKNKEKSVQKTIDELDLHKISERQLEEIIRQIVKEKRQYIMKYKKQSINPLMGIIMKKIKGKAEGKTINKILNQEIEKII